MITVKTRCLLLILCLVLLTGCSANLNDGFDVAADMLEDSKKKNISCEIVYADGASAELVEEAKFLAAEIEEQTEMDTLTRSEGEGYSQKVLYVVLGRTDDGYTEHWFDKMRSDDYICRVSGNVMALGGVSDKSTLAAMDAFRNDVLPTAEYGWLGDDGTLFSYAGEYEMDGVYLNGYAWGDYTLLVSDAGLLHAAEDIRARVADRSGEYPRIRIGQKGSEAKEIIISVNDKLDMPTAELWAEGTDVYVQSDSKYGIYEGLDRLYSQILDSTCESTARVEISKKLEYKYFDGRISVACISADINESLGDERMKEAAEDIIDRKIDIVVVNLGNDNFLNFKNQNQIRQNYNAVCENNIGAVYARKDTVSISNLNLSETGEGRIAEFQVKTVSGEKSYSFISAWGEVDVSTLSSKISSAVGDTVAVITASAQISAEGCRADIDAREYGVQILSDINIEQSAREFENRYGYTLATVKLKNSHPRALS